MRVQKYFKPHSAGSEKLVFMNILNRITRVVKKYNPAMFSNDEWLNEIERSYPNGVDHGNFFLPSFPDETLQKNTVGCHGSLAIRQAFAFYENASHAMKNISSDPRSRKVLDFGTGWGRISRFFIKDVGRENIFGVDVEKPFIEICRKSFKSNNFSVINPYPPLEFNSETFDLVTLYSVFSHLSEDACNKWVQEFYRILKPGGAVAFTTRAVGFFDYCEALKSETNNPYLKSLGNLFENFDDAKKRYSNGEFVFSGAEGVDGGGAMNTSFYGESFIPQQYVERVFCAPGLFKKAERILPKGLVDQETFILYK